MSGMTYSISLVVNGLGGSRAMSGMLELPCNYVDFKIRRGEAVDYCWGWLP